MTPWDSDETLQHIANAAFDPNIHVPGYANIQNLIRSGRIPQSDLDASIAAARADFDAEQQSARSTLAERTASHAEEAKARASLAADQQLVWDGERYTVQGMPSKDSFVDKVAGLIPYAGAALITGGAAGAFGAGAGGAGAAGAAGATGAGGLSAAELAGLAGGGEVGSGYAASASPWWLSGAGDSAGFVGGGTDALSGGGDAFDLGGGLTVDEFGNTTGGLFEGGPGTPGAGDFGGGSMTWDDLVNYAKKAGGYIPGGFIKGLIRGVPGAIGAVGANQQSNAYADLANKYLDIGAPSRARYEGSYAPGFSMEKDPGYTDALNQSAKATLHGLSVTGNPADSPNAWNQSLTDLYQKTAYPALQTYRNQNAASGGMATLTQAAPGASSNAITAQGNVLNSVGAAANDIFNPPKSLAQILREIKTAGG